MIRRKEYFKNGKTKYIFCDGLQEFGYVYFAEIAVELGPPVMECN